MDTLTRGETLQVLKAMGVDLPPDTKLPLDTLDKRLRDALTASQYLYRLPSPLNLTSLPEWPLVQPNASFDINPGAGSSSANGGRLLLEAVRRGNMDEARRNYVSKMVTGDAKVTLYVDPFMDLRQTVMGIANFLDSGARWCLMQDQEKDKCAVNIRMVSVLEIDEQTPAIVVLYRAFDRSTAMEGLEWAFEQVDSNPPQMGEVMCNVTATPLEQKLLLKHLKNNAHLVPPDYPLNRQRTEGKFKASVILPIGPLEFDALAKLNHNTGCFICGQKAKSRCSRCQSVAYCGPVCQQTDWPSHKAACKSLAGGRWCNLTTRAGPPGTENGYVAFLNKYSSTGAGFAGSDVEKHITKIGAAAAPPNVWGDRLFIVKMQLGLDSKMDQMMVYDRKRSFQVFIAQEDNSDRFADVRAEMWGPRGGYGGVKMYRWAKRTGDWELSVCLDRVPKADTSW